jgi:3-hydroxyacyl-[acyl-carrier-protein] dehydratase
VRSEILSSIEDARGSPRGGLATIRFAPDLEVFRGHFPGDPVVPGVHLVEAARALAERLAGEPLDLCAVDEARFTAEVRPGEAVEAEVRIEDGAGALACCVAFRVRGTDAASVRVTLGRRG